MTSVPMSQHTPIKLNIHSAGMGREGRFSERNNPGHCGTHSCVQVDDGGGDDDGDDDDDGGDDDGDDVDVDH